MCGGSRCLHARVAALLTTCLAGPGQGQEIVVFKEMPVDANLPISREVAVERAAQYAGVTVPEFAAGATDTTAIRGLPDRRLRGTLCS